MDCDRWQNAISASADGEDPELEDRLIDAHLSSCAACRSFAAAIEGSRRRLAVQGAPEMPDLSRHVSKRVAVADRMSRWGVARALLAVVAIEVIVLSAPSLLDNANHDGRHLGAFSIAYGVSLLVVVARPARARTVLPVAAVLAGALVITTVVDLGRGVVPLTDEATHLPELFSVVLVWLLTVPSPRRGGSEATGRHSGSPVLRVVCGAHVTDESGRAGRAGRRAV